MYKDNSSLNNFVLNLNEIEKTKTNEILFSIIIPVYNVEKYLEETIISVINQSLDFEKYIQIILVNDGSTDSSGEICENYKEKYPNNIIYLKKENGGVSSARNLGLYHAQGKYLNFVDSDDILDLETLLNVYEFFEKSKEEIDLVAIPVTFFEARQGPHILNYKFDKSKIIDVEREPYNIQLSASSSFIKRDIASKFSFNEFLKYGEDAEFVNKVILEKKKYGILDNVNYFYRIRNEGTSAIQNTRNSKDLFQESVDYFLKSLIEYSLAQHGYVLSYIQYVVLYDLQWKFKIREISNDVLNESEVIDFFRSTIPILKYINEDVIKKQRFLNVHLKYFILKLKYFNSSDVTANKIVTKDDVKLFFNGSILSSLKDQSVYIELININQNIITLEGFFGSLFNRDECEILIKVNEEFIKTELVERPLKNTKVLGAVVKRIYGFRVEVPINSFKKANIISIYVKSNGLSVQVKINPSIKAPLAKNRPSYYAKGDLLVYIRNNNFFILPNSTKNRLKYEYKVFRHLFKKKNKVLKKVALIRMFYTLLSGLFKNRKIFLFMDRIDKADDNAEALFKYANNINDRIKKYFVISKDSNDLNEVKKVGKVVYYGSYYHRLLLLFSGKLISSQADEVVLNPFGKIGQYYKDLLNYDFIFLQHGVLQNDLSNWLNKYHKNIKLFITSSPYEKNTVVGNSYGYKENEVLLTGLPRFDFLKDNNNKEILIMPTWRKNIVGYFNLNGKRKYNDDFKNSEYFYFYNKLINDKNIINKAKQNGYKINFVLHPNITAQINDFDKNDYVKIIDPSDTSYNKLFNNSSLMITDYSSVSFDFAYLRKPLLYFQFDYNDFHKSHLSRGYFNYETMGFGPVIESYDTLVQKVIEYIDQDCVIDIQYLKRINNFFAFNDSNNRKRIYDQILKM